MAQDLNKVILTGRLVRDIDVRSTQTGKTVGNFSFAVGRNAEEADFFDVTVWDKTAELMQKYTQKGSRILLEGSLRQDSWDDKETGKKRSKVVINAFSVQFLDSKSQSSQTGSQQQTDTVPNDVDDKPLDLSEIPF